MDFRLYPHKDKTLWKHSQLTKYDPFVFENAVIQELGMCVAKSWAKSLGQNTDRAQSSAIFRTEGSLDAAATVSSVEAKEAVAKLAVACSKAALMPIVFLSNVII